MSLLCTEIGRLHKARLVMVGSTSCGIQLPGLGEEDAKVLVVDA